MPDTGPHAPAQPSWWHGNRMPCLWLHKCKCGRGQLHYLPYKTFFYDGHPLVFRWR